jgi:diadenosine tetraphosphate (Ap4A) HIT family hydrolase
MSCIFCEIPEERIVCENDLAVAILDRHPVNPGHMLIIPRRHIVSFFDVTNEEIIAINELLHKCKYLLDEQYHPDGYNVGVNCGSAAGQTIMHVHVHLIPRHSGDIENPRGGVRGVIPERRVY